MELNKANLQQKYVEEKNSTRECAKIFGVTQRVISLRMKEYGIKGRPKTENKIPTKKGETLSEEHRKKIARQRLKRIGDINDYVWNGKKFELIDEKKPVCPVCGKRFVYKYSCKSICCSMECALKRKREKAVIIKTCPQCKKEFYAGGKELPPKKTIYCSLSCASKNKSNTIRKPLSEVGRNSRAWKELREEILKRDNYKCQVCGKDRKLQVHHKERRSLNGNDKYNNLVTVCNGCHNAWDRLCYWAEKKGNWEKLNKTLEEIFQNKK